MLISAQVFDVFAPLPARNYVIWNAGLGRLGCHPMSELVRMHRVKFAVAVAEIITLESGRYYRATVRDTTGEESLIAL
jgi:hypothetical protein